MMTRRRLLGATGTTVAVAVAGCLDSSGGATCPSHTVRFLNTEFDEFEVDLDRFVGSVPRSGDIEVTDREFVATGSDGGELTVEFVAPADTDQVRVAVDLFNADPDVPSRTVTEPRTLDAEGDTPVSHTVSLRPPSVFENDRVRVDHTEPGG